MSSSRGFGLLEKELSFFRWNLRKSENHLEFENEKSSIRGVEHRNSASMTVNMLTYDDPCRRAIVLL